MRSTPAAEKIAKLIPRLATEHDGEVVATVRAIERTLKGAGLDFHALAASLSVQPGRQQRHQEPPKQEAPNGPPKTWGELAAWCFAHDNGRLSPKEREFIADMMSKLFRYGDPTPRQGEWLRAIYGKLLRASA